MRPSQQMEGLSELGASADFHTATEPEPRCLALCAYTGRYRSARLNWHFRPHSPTLTSTTIQPEEGLVIVTAQQLCRRLVLRVQAPLASFSRVSGPKRGDTLQQCCLPSLRPFQAAGWHWIPCDPCPTNRFILTAPCFLAH